MHENRCNWETSGTSVCTVDNHAAFINVYGHWNRLARYLMRDEKVTDVKVVLCTAK